MRHGFRFVAALVIAVLGCAVAALAHPLGNFTVNHLTRITTTRTALTVRYVLDQAEIPTFALDRSLDAHGTPSAGVLAGWARAHAAAITSQLSLTVDGRLVPLAVVSSSAVQRPGAGGLPTLYFTADYTAPLEPGPHRLVYRDGTETGRLGWKDVVVGNEREPTAGLRAYPSAELGSPRARTAIAAAVDGAGHVRAGANDVDASSLAAIVTPASPPLGRMNALSDVLAGGAHDVRVVLGALLLAVALGALHALEPGHGKTLLAVSLVGARATPRQALILASALTLAHTAGVLALGVIVLAAAQWTVPERVYPWITLGSGAFITVLGARALAREIHGRLAHGRFHAHAHAHPHTHAHSHPHTHTPPDTAPLTFRSALLAAASGNFAPCPAALVVLLAAIALHQVGYGLTLIVAFSIGLAAVLTALGIAVVRGAAWLLARPRFDRLAHLAPLVTAAVIACVGAVMVAQGFAAAGIAVPLPLVATLVLTAAAGYAFTRHDHPRITVTQSKRAPSTSLR